MNKYLMAWKEGRTIDRANNIALGISHPLYMKMRELHGAIIIILIFTIGMLIGQLWVLVMTTIQLHGAIIIILIFAISMLIGRLRY